MIITDEAFQQFMEEWRGKLQRVAREHRQEVLVVHGIVLMLWAVMWERLRRFF